MDSMSSMSHTSAVDPLGDAFRPGPIDHLGVVATDIEATMRSFGSLYGLPWTHTVIDAPRTYLIRGEEVAVTMNVGHINAPTALEFVNAVEGTPWERRERPYLHHVAYRVNDFRLECEKFIALGADLVLTLPDDRLEPTGAAYFDYCGLVVELLDSQYRF